MPPAMGTSHWLDVPYETKRVQTKRTRLHLQQPTLYKISRQSPLCRSNCQVETWRYNMPKRTRRAVPYRNVKRVNIITGTESCSNEALRTTPFNKLPHWSSFYNHETSARLQKHDSARKRAEKLKQSPGITRTVPT